MQQTRGSGGIHAPPGKSMTLRLFLVASQMTIRFINLTTSPVAQYCMQIKDEASTSVKVVSTEDNRRTQQNSMPQSQR